VGLVFALMLMAVVASGCGDPEIDKCVNAVKGSSNSFPPGWDKDSIRAKCKELKDRSDQYGIPFNGNDWGR
jgi:hypothetical protein